MQEEKGLKMTEEFLDSIDIKLILERNRGKKVCAIMDIIEKLTNEDLYVLGNPDVFAGNVFNHMNEDDFMEYVERRYYNPHIFEEVSYFVVR